MPKFYADGTATSSDSGSDTDVELLEEISAVKTVSQSDQKTQERKRPHPKDSCWVTTSKKAKMENPPTNVTICALLGHIKGDIMKITKKIDFIGDLVHKVYDLLEGSETEEEENNYEDENEEENEDENEEQEENNENKEIQEG